MSAKRRAETIASFSIPVKDAPTIDEEPVGMSSRLRHPTQSQPQQMEVDDGGDDASDFAPDDDQSDYSDTEFDGVEEPRAKRGRGKGKAKVKGKAPAKSRILEALRELDGEPNPRVMLISLKGESFVIGNMSTLKVVSQLGL
jgi:SWI/SNF-related matrix-associated actin-dependent regulator of chromatin subfamily A3